MSNTTETKLPTPPRGLTGKWRKASALEDGQSITGTLKAVTKSFSEKFKNEQVILKMEDNGVEFNLAATGTLIDSVRAGQFEVGTTYRIQKEGLEKTNKGNYRGKFGIYVISNDGI